MKKFGIKRPGKSCKLNKYTRKLQGNEEERINDL